MFLWKTHYTIGGGGGKLTSLKIILFSFAIAQSSFISKRKTFVSCAASVLKDLQWRPIRKMCQDSDF